MAPMLHWGRSRSTSSIWPLPTAILLSLKKAFEAYGGSWDKETVASALAHGGKVKLCLACDGDCFLGLSTLHRSSQKMRARKPEACDGEAPSKRPRVSADAPRQKSQD